MSHSRLAPACGQTNPGWRITPGSLAYNDGAVGYVRNN